jgi:hypothetical protein
VSEINLSIFEYLYALLHTSFADKSIVYLSPQKLGDSWWISVEEDGHTVLVEWNHNTPRDLHILYLNKNDEITVTSAVHALSVIVGFVDKGKAR